MTIDYKLIGKHIKAQRLQKGITQEIFAERMNVSVGYISQLERGITKISLERLASISETLECDMNYLIEGVSSVDRQYFSKDFNELYQQLNSNEKRLLAILVKDYLDNR